MTTKAAFNAEDWSVVTTAPYLAALLVVAADRGGTVRETMAISRAYASAREYYTDVLLRDILSTAPTVAPATVARGPEQLHDQALATVRRAVTILARVASEEEVNNYKRFVFFVAETVAHAHREGGFMGIGGRDVSEDEQAVLDEIAAIFDAPHPQ